MKANARTLLFGISLGLLLLLHFPSSPAAVVTLSPATDTFINSLFPDNNDGANTWFDVGRDGMGGVRRGLIRFDFSSIPPVPRSIPPSCISA